jgi:ribosomal protein S18 acetylase RimI-like enzyme
MQEREFGEQRDVTKLQAFLAEMRSQGTPAGTFQFGDLMYEMYHPLTGFDPEADIRIWESDDGGLCGFVFYRPPDNPEFFIRSEFCDSRIEDEMLSWSLARAEERGVGSIETSCLDSDAAKAGFLSRRGFTKQDDVCVLMERSLAESLPACQLPEGYSVVTLAERPECACGIPDSGMARDLYKRVQRASGYKADLDVRAFYCDHDLASGCTCWYDEVHNCGQFQPVGTSKEHRRVGLASAVMTKAMENLRRYGADRALVWTDAGLAPAVRLYRSLGFRIAHEDYAWKREVRDRGSRRVHQHQTRHLSDQAVARRQES